MNKHFDKFVVCAMTIVALSGCASIQPQIKTSILEGKIIVHHIDTEDPPGRCNISWLSGCYQERNGIHHVWYTSITPAHMVSHEVKGHAIEGMSHDNWQYSSFRKSACSTVTVGSKSYPLGSIICVDDHREYVLPPGSFI